MTYQPGKIKRPLSLFRKSLSWLEIMVGGMLLVVGLIVWSIGEERTLTYIFQFLFPGLASEKISTDPAQFVVDFFRFIEFSFGSWFITFPILMFIVMAADMAGIITGATLVIVGLVLRKNGWWPWLAQLLIPLDVLVALVIWTEELNSAHPFPE